MNPIRRWLSERKRRRVEAECELGDRLDDLLARVRTRLPQDRYASLAEYAGQAEWELAIESIWAETDEANSGLRLTPAEERELAALADHPAVNQALLTRPLSEPPSRDIQRR